MTFHQWLGQQQKRQGFVGNLARDLLCPANQPHVAKFKTLLLVTLQVASFGQLAQAVYHLSRLESAVFLVSLMVSVASIITLVIVLPVVTFYLACKASLETKRFRWVLYGLFLIGVQVALFNVAAAQERNYQDRNQVQAQTADKAIVHGGQGRE